MNIWLIILLWFVVIPFCCMTVYELTKDYISKLWNALDEKLQLWFGLFLVFSAIGLFIVFPCLDSSLSGWGYLFYVIGTISVVAAFSLLLYIIDYISDLIKNRNYDRIVLPVINKDFYTTFRSANPPYITGVGLEEKEYTHTWIEKDGFHKTCEWWCNFNSGRVGQMSKSEFSFGSALYNYATKSKNLSVAIRILTILHARHKMRKRANLLFLLVMILFSAFLPFFIYFSL